MRATLRDLKLRGTAALRRRARDWTRRRQGADAERIVLDRRRIYILPTRLGAGFAIMVITMLIGGMNYDNNLGVALGLLLGSLGLVAMHHCHGTLLGLVARLAAAEPAFVGGRVAFRLVLDNQSRVARPQVRLAADHAESVACDVPSAGSATASIELPAMQRGRVELRRYVMATTHPLGLFRAWSVAHPAWSAIVFPALAPRGLLPSGVHVDTGGAQDGRGGDEDFAGLKPFQPGDALSRIAWKAHARGLGLHTKRYAGTRVTSHVFDWASLPALPPEARLSQLARWVVDAHARGEAFGLRLPGVEIAANLGKAHRQECLTALAVFDTGAAGRARG